MEENIEMEFTVEMTYSQAMFFKHFSKEIDVENYIPDSVEWYKEEGGIHIKGRSRLVKRGRFIKLFFCSVELSQHRLVPVLIQFFYLRKFYHIFIRQNWPGRESKEPPEVGN